MAILGFAGVFAAVALMLSLSRARAGREERLGSVSPQWLAEHRATHPS